MNNKGQVVFYGFMLGIVIIVLALALVVPVKEFVDDARDNSQLNCTSTTSNFEKGACIVADLTIFHFIGGLIFIAGAIIGARIIFT